MLSSEQAEKAVDKAIFCYRDDQPNCTPQREDITCFSYDVVIVEMNSHSRGAITGEEK